MNDPKRLLADPNAPAFQRELLAAFADERPSNDAKKRTLAALGISAVAAGGIAASSSAGASIAPKALGLSLVVKFVIGALVVAAGAAGVATYAQFRAAPEPIAQSPQSPQSPQSKSSRELARMAPVETHETPRLQAPITSSNVPAPSQDALKQITTAAPSHPSHVAAAIPAASSTLGAELATIDRARQFLDLGEVSWALDLLDNYESEYKNGAFIQEAEALRVQALVAKGDRAGAERVGRKFLARYPSSPHADKVRRLLGSSR